MRWLLHGASDPLGACTDIFREETDTRFLEGDGDAKSGDDVYRVHAG
jgi:hypothetical protein